VDFDQAGGKPDVALLKADSSRSMGVRGEALRNGSMLICIIITLFYTT